MEDQWLPGAKDQGEGTNCKGTFGADKMLPTS